MGLVSKEVVDAAPVLIARERLSNEFKLKVLAFVSDIARF